MELNFLILTINQKSLSDFISILKNLGDIKIYITPSGKRAFEIIDEKEFDLIITDEILQDMTGLDFARMLVLMHPMINCAVINSLSHEEFHEASEGLGLIMQLPHRPGERVASELLEQLSVILLKSKKYLQGIN